MEFQKQNFMIGLKGEGTAKAGGRSKWKFPLKIDKGEGETIIRISVWMFRFIVQILI